MPARKEAKQPLGQSARAASEKLALVIPTLHEAESLRGLLARVLQVLDGMDIPCEVLVVDDDSRDGTAEMVAEIARQDGRVRLLVRKGKTGLSGAILHGWQNTDAGILAVMDADLQHPPEVLPQLCKCLLEGRDLAIGSRYARGGGLGEWNPVRRLISYVAVAATFPVQRRGLRARDPLSGFFTVRRHCVEDVAFRTAGFKLLLEILVRGRVRSVGEVPFVFGRRSAGRSKASLRVAWQYLLLLFELYGQPRVATGVAQAELSGD
jgi:dolichol-phosphate mannosyltransferase